jgi:hypothetical protein
MADNSNGFLYNLEIQGCTKKNLTKGQVRKDVAATLRLIASRIERGANGGGVSSSEYQLRVDWESDFMKVPKPPSL